MDIHARMKELDQQFNDDMTTAESNKIFADFDPRMSKYEPKNPNMDSPRWCRYTDETKKSILSEHSVEHLVMYSKSWDWIMPVVEKLRSLGIEFTIELRKQGWRIVFFKPDQNLLIDVWGKFGPEVVYTGALQAIQWYNEQTKS